MFIWLALFIPVALLLSGSLGGCVSKKKYEAALQKNARLSVDSTFQEYDMVDLAYSKDGVIYEQHKELLAKSNKLDSLTDIVTKQRKTLKNIQSILDKLEHNEWTVEEIEGKLSINLESNILFESGSNNISLSGKNVLKSISTAINNLDQDVSVWVMGHTDNQPYKNSEKDNWDLSAERALAVVRIMVDNNVEPSIITASARSKYDPLKTLTNDSSKKYNRRTEIIIQPTENIAEVLTKFINSKS